jgi:hypothetical protein
MRLVLILSLFLVGCGITSGNPGGPTGDVKDSDLIPYYTRFLNYNKVITHQDVPPAPSLEIKFSDSLGGRVIGLCTWYGNGHRSVQIAKWFWQSHGESAKEQLMFHELGHCLLDRQHNDTMVYSVDANQQVALSVMNSYHLSSSLYEGNYDSYIKELFTCSPLYNPTLCTQPSSLYSARPSSFHDYASQVKEFKATTDDFSLDEGGDITDFHCDEE